MEHQAHNRIIKASFALLLLAPIAIAGAQSALPPAALAKQAIENRKAVFTLIGNNFKPIGEVLRGNATYSSTEVAKFAARISFLTGFLPEVFPDISRNGDTRAVAEVWSNRADFDKRVKDFTAHASTLTQLVSHDGSNTDAFKDAAKAVAQDCKSCHDTYRSK